MILLKPKTQFLCDKCNKTITNPDEGYVQWLSNEYLQYYGFKIVHHKSSSSLNNKNGCYFYNNNSDLNDIPLEYFIGDSGLSLMLTFLNEKVKLGKERILDTNEYIEFIRRLQIPYYEQVSHMFDLHESYDERNTVSPDNLKHLLECVNIAA
jgi:hypothetical protein|tara:strand:- start:53 stop:508 length:456 start_codon:yes stop_codon:yes gene_type:complete